MTALGRSRRSRRCIPERMNHLLPPSFPRQKAKIIQAHSQGLTPAGQPLQDLRREIREPQLPTDMAFGQPDGFGQFLNGCEFARLRAPPPAPSWSCRVFVPLQVLV